MPRYAFERLILTGRADKDFEMRDFELRAGEEAFVINLERARLIADIQAPYREVEAEAHRLGLGVVAASMAASAERMSDKYYNQVYSLRQTDIADIASDVMDYKRKMEMESSINYLYQQELGLGLFEKPTVTESLGALRTVLGCTPKTDRQDITIMATAYMESAMYSMQWRNAEDPKALFFAEEDGRLYPRQHVGHLREYDIPVGCVLRELTVGSTLLLGISPDDPEQRQKLIEDKLAEMQERNGDPGDEEGIKARRWRAELEVTWKNDLYRVIPQD